MGINRNKQTPRPNVLPPSQHPRVSLHNAAPDFIDKATMDSPPMPVSVLRLLALAQRMADRCVRGKFGLALENDARATLELWDELPSEIRELL